MATQSFTRRLLQRRPPIECVVGRVPYAAWRQFAPFHYLTAELHKAARCFGLWADGTLAAFAADLHFPHPTVRDIVRCSRGVTLPDWQGVGLMSVLNERRAAAYKVLGKRMRLYPAHPALVRTYDKSPLWRLVREPGEHGARLGANAGHGAARAQMRPCAVFEYVGPAHPDRAEAERLIQAA